MTNHSDTAAALGCATILAVIGISICGALALLYAVVYVAASAWSAAS